MNPGKDAITIEQAVLEARRHGEILCGIEAGMRAGHHRLETCDLCHDLFPVCTWDGTPGIHFNGCQFLCPRHRDPIA